MAKWAVSMDIVNPPEALQKEFNRASKAGITRVARYHWRERIPLRFQQQSALSPLAQELGFQPRSRGYERRKARIHGHRRPLVWSGRMYETVTTHFREPRASRAKTGEIRTTLRLTAPYWVRFRGKRGTGPDMRAELSNISQDEATLYARMLSEHVQRRLERVHERKRVA